MRRFWVLFIMMFGCSFAWGQVKRDPPLSARLVKAALERTAHEVVYDGAYRGIAYPGGDVPDHTGVCTDVVIRSYRKLGIDLQVLVHEDMKANFSKYPKKMGFKENGYQY